MTAQMTGEMPQYNTEGEDLALKTAIAAGAGATVVFGGTAVFQDQLSEAMSQAAPHQAEQGLSGMYEMTANMLESGAAISKWAAAGSAALMAAGVVGLRVRRQNAEAEYSQREELTEETKEKGKPLISGKKIVGILAAVAAFNGFAFAFQGVAEQQAASFLEANIDGMMNEEDALLLEDMADHLDESGMRAALFGVGTLTTVATAALAAGMRADRRNKKAEEQKQQLEQQGDFAERTVLAEYAPQVRTA